MLYYTSFIDNIYVIFLYQIAEIDMAKHDIHITNFVIPYIKFYYTIPQNNISFWYQSLCTVIPIFSSCGIS